MNASARLFVGWAKVWCASQQTTAKILRWVKEDCRTGKCAPHKSCFSLHLLSAYKLRCSDSLKESILWKIDGNGNTCWTPLERTLVPDPSLDGNGST